MKVRQILYCIIGIIFLLCFSSCVSQNEQKQNLVLKGTFSDEVVTLDPFFVARQKQAVHSFFGPTPSNQEQNPNNADADLEDEMQIPETQHSMTPRKDLSANSFYGGIEIIWPTNGTLTSLFGVRSLRKKTRMHTGIDIGAAKGTPIKAAADGQVLFAGIKHGYGYSVIIGHDNSHETLYAHMSKITVRVGQFITRDKLIGFVGKTGRVTGANLHFETRVNGVAYDPLEFLPPTQRGKAKIGMKTPSVALQLEYYKNNNHLAYSHP